jgi:hypothetical protein
LAALQGWQQHSKQHNVHHHTVQRQATSKQQQHMLMDKGASPMKIWPGQHKVMKKLSGYVCLLHLWQLRKGQSQVGHARHKRPSVSVV